MDQSNPMGKTHNNNNNNNPHLTWRNHIEMSSSELYSDLLTQNNTARKTRGILPRPLYQHHIRMFKARDDPKGPEEHSLTMNRYKIPIGSQKRTLLGGPKERKARKACQKAMMVFRRLAFARTKEQARTSLQNKGRGEDQEGKG